VKSASTLKIRHHTRCKGAESPENGELAHDPAIPGPLFRDIDELFATGVGQYSNIGIIQESGPCRENQTPAETGITQWRPVIMSKQSIRKPLSLAIGAAVLGAAGLASAGDTVGDADLFTMDQLDNSQLIAGSHKEGGCGEGKCGEDSDSGEGSCGENKGGEGEGSCGENKDGKGEGSCGEGKCGGSS
jgi:uncharacterized low-complexity protein